MTLSAHQLRSVINMLSDPGSAANAAGILAREAKERGVLVADLVAQTAPSPSPAAPAPKPRWQDVDDEADDDGDSPIARRIDYNHYGLIAFIVAETIKAWCVETPGGRQAWLAKSIVEHHGEDPHGRAIFTLPSWLATKIEIAS